MEIEIKIGKDFYKIPCTENEKAKLLDLAKIIDKKFKELESHLKNLDQKSILLIVALLTQREIENIKNKKTAELEDDIYDAISDTMENVTDYIKKFTKRIQKY